MDDLALQEAHRISLRLSVELEKRGFLSVPVPSEPYDSWDPETMTGKGLLSLRHAGYLAGLGAIGRNGLLCNARFGNLIKLGAVITEAELDQDPIVVRFYVPIRATPA